MIIERNCIDIKPVKRGMATTTTIVVNNRNEIKETDNDSTLLKLSFSDIIFEITKIVNHKGREFINVIGHIVLDEKYGKTKLVYNYDSFIKTHEVGDESFNRKYSSIIKHGLNLLDNL